ncbi:phage protein [Streptococcus dysgalactiae]|nr:phage protein [Streptococcus dysgalactiae]
MISVFPSTAYTTKELAGVGYPILDLWCKSATLYATMNGEQYIKLVIPHRAKGVKINLLPKDLDIIKIHDMNGDEDYYRVRRPVVTLKTTTIYAEHITYDLNNNFIEDIYIYNRDGQGAMDKISKGTQYDHPFILRSNIKKLSNIRLVRVNPIQALIGSADNTFLKRYGGELKRQGFTLSINNRIGVDRTDVIRTGKNLTGFECDYDFDNVVTRIMPKGPNGILLPEKYVDSPLINNYPFPLIKDVEYKVEYDGEFNNLSDAEKKQIYDQLRALAKADFEAGCDLPSAKYKVNFTTLKKTIEYKNYQALENIGLGDMQPVYEGLYDISIKGRVTHIEWDLLNLKYISIELGNFDKGIIKSSLNHQASIKEKIDEAWNTATIALASADGKTTNYYGTDEPKNPQKGDTWFKKNGEEEEIWHYEDVDGKLMWVYKIGTNLISDLENRINQNIEDIGVQIIKINQRNDKELEEFRETLKNLALPEEAIKKITEAIKVDDIPSIKQSFDDLKNKVSETSEESRLTAEILGNNGKTRYNKNLLVGEPNRTKSYDQDFIELEANDGGFKRGETYTISFSQTCELLQKVAITLTQTNNKGLKLVLTPTKAKMDAQTFDLTKDKEVISVYPLSYSATLSGDWYKSKQVDLNASDKQNLALEMSYKDVVDAKGATIIGKQSDKPKIILDGRRDR